MCLHAVYQHSNSTPGVTPERILKEVCSYYGFKAADINRTYHGSRTRDKVMARRMFMKLTHELTMTTKVMLCRKNNLMDNTLSFVSINSQGHGTGRIEYICDLLEQFNFVLWQEHWLHDKEVLNLNSVFNDYNIESHGVSRMDETVFNLGRPYGGCAILWDKSMLAKVKPIVTKCKRFVAVHVVCDSITFLLINVYMPTGCNHGNGQSFSDDYCDVLIEISAVCSTTSCDNIIIGGDFHFT